MTSGSHPRLLRRFSFWLAAGMGCAIVLTVVMGVLAWVGANNAARDARWIAQIQAARNAFDATDAHVVDVRLYSRGYVITGEPDLLDSYQAARTSLQSDVENLQRLSSPNSSREQQVGRFVAEADQLIRFTQLIIARKQAGRPLPDAEQWKESTRLANVARTQLQEMEAAEGALLEQRTISSERSGRRTLRIVLGGTVLGITFLTLAGFVIQHEIGISAQARGKLRALNVELEQRVEQRTAELRASQERLNLALDAANARTWEWDLRSNDNAWSDQLWKLYGVEPNPCTPSYEAWRSVLDPDTHQEAVQTVAEAVRSGRDLNFEFCVRHEDGKARWLLARGRPVPDAAGKPVTYLGIVMDVTGHKHAQARDSQLAAIVDSSSDAILSKDLKGKILSWNRAAEKLYGYSEREALGKPVAMIVPPDQLDEYNLILDTIRLGKVIDREDTVRLRKDGSRVEVSLTVSPIRNPEGAVVGASSVAHDISERKRAENALRRSEARLQLQFESMPFGCVVWDGEFRVESWNPAANKIFGFRVSQVLGKHYQMFVTPESSAHVDAVFERLRQGDSPIHSTNKNLTADGRVITCRWVNMPLREPSGEITGALSMVEDITEREQAAAALRESELRFHQLLDSEAEAVFGADPEGQCTFCNAAGARLLGYDSSRELVGRNIHTLMHHARPDGSHFPAEECPVLGAIKLGTAIHLDNDCFWRKDGTSFPVECWAYPMYQDSRVAGAVITCVDITERRQAQESLREQARILDLTQVLVCDLEDRIVMWNKGAEELFGFSGPEAVGQIAHQLLQSEFPEPLEQIHATVLRAGRWEGEILQRRRDGTLLVIASQWVLHYDQQGQPARILQSNTDITARRQLQEQLLAQAGELSAQASELARTETALREQTMRLQLVLESMSEGLVAADRSGQFLLWNKAADRIMGLPLKSMPIEEWPSYYGMYLPDRTTCYPAQELPLAQAISGRDVEAEIFVRNNNRPDGAWIEVSARPIKDTNATIIGSVAVFRDVTDRKGTERALRSLSACNESLLRATDERTLLQEICDVMVDVGHYRMAWIGYPEADAAKTVRPVAQSGFVSGYLDGLNITWADEERGHGPTGTAIRTGETTVCHDMQCDPRFAPWREKALARGYRSSMVLPLKGGESVLGAISIYSTETRAFDQNAQNLLEELANNFGYGIMALRARQERRRANEEMRSAHQRLLDIVEFLPDATLVVDREGMVIAWNRAIEEMTGVPKRDILGKGGYAYAVPFYGSPQPMMVDMVRGENQDVEARYGHFQRRDRFVSGDIFIPTIFGGKGAHLFVTAAALQDPEGNYCGAIESIRDVTERKQAEEQLIKINLELDERVQLRTAELRESEQRVRRKLDSILSPEGDLNELALSDILDIPAIQALLDSFHEVVHVTTALLDLSGKILTAVGWQDVCTNFHRVNPETCKNCLESDLQLSAGVPAGDFKIYKCKNNMWDVSTPIVIGGQHMGNLFCGQFFFGDESVDFDSFRQQAKQYGFDEETYLTAVRAAPRLTHREVTTSMGFLAKLAQMISQLSYHRIQLARSSSQLGLVNAELAASVQEMEAFTYSVSHDLRAPLRHMGGFSKILMEDFAAKLPPEARGHLARIVEGTTRMGILVDELLNLSRVRRQAINLQSTSLNSLVSEVIAILQPEISGRHVEWKIAELPLVECDPTLARQIFQNLLSNALKFSRNRAPAVIEVGQTDHRGQPAIFVRDNGVGFDMKYADKLFGVFQRLHHADEFEGTGIGLATVQRIVKKHGGEIWVQAAPDQGASFYFYLTPRQETEATTHAAAGGA